MIKIRSVYDIKTFRAFQKFALKKVFILAYCCAIILLLIAILFAFLDNGSYLTYLLCGVLLPVSMHAFYKILELENLNKNLYLRDTTVQIFIFNEEGIELEQISKYDSFKETYTYKDIIRVIKYKQYYFLYINRVQAFIVNNIDYVFGNEEELDDLLRNKKADNFIKKGRFAKKH